ncbi:RING finger protein 121 [Coccinella septempunctata]|uniref:RING finger protein 121 n=1 Tax=Coccinella septempunctata TaxID=41139 RepID=UPI001D0630D2|nr:RING finger protein 121 [Coccinella septempunctata]
MDLHEPVILGNRTFDELSQEEKMRYEHQKMHEQHKGHDKMHAEMFVVLVITLIVAQFLLIEWKKRHYRTYSFVTLLGLWLVPFFYSLKYHFWRFIFTWLLFTCISGLIAKKAVEKPIHRTTPRLVYKWFLFLYKLSYVLGLIGYFVFLATFFGLNIVFNSKPNLWMECGTLFVFYGVYYGVLGRDISEICADKMASHIGYYTDQGIPTRHLDPNVCAVCGNKLLVPENEEGIIENTYKLSCEHVFHEFCIRGWCIVGKKQTCPYCKEKVDLKKMFCNPWEKPHVLYGQLLDWIRWLLAWQPMIIFIVQGINWVLGLE